MSVSDYIESEYNSDLDDDYVLYVTRKESRTKYNILVCELYNRRIHGNDNSDVLYHYLLHSRYKILDMNIISETTNYLNNEYVCLRNKRHDIFRNYKQIITMDNYIKPEITECIYLNTGHCVAILKTFWLRLVQRKWKNIIKERNTIIKKRCNLDSLRHREITGKWPEDCLRIPQFKGMLAELKTNVV